MSRPTTGSPHASSPCYGLTFALSQHHHLIHRLSRKGLGRSVRPDDLDGLDTLRSSQAEVGARVVAAEVTISGINAAQPASSPGTDRDLCTVGIPPQSGIQGADEQPVTALRG